jgi:dTDP-4-amino-4,6-dideoxy-D-galactose acyltransferase
MHLLAKREKALRFYSPYNFLKEIDAQTQFDFFIKDKLAEFNHKPNSFIYAVNVTGNDFIFLYKHLGWDSAFLQRKSFKLFTVLYENPDAAALQAAIISFKAHLVKHSFAYGFIDIPAEDTFLIQNLTKSGFQMVETRLHFFKDHLKDFKEERYPVRKAMSKDSDAVAEVARTSKNEYDRLHADFNFPDELADEYLEVYAKATVNGFSDAVLIPAVAGLPVASFLAISHLKGDAEKLNTPLARIVLTAVAPANKGWHQKLVSETIYYAREMGAAYVLMTTQATNRAVFRTCEKLKFKLGGTSHILSFSN